jgi:3D (Asp-Asp-Asp) domain-containing protein
VSTTRSTFPAPSGGLEQARPAPWRRRRPGRLARPAAIAAAVPLALWAGTSLTASPKGAPHLNAATAGFVAGSNTDHSPDGPGQVGAYGQVPNLGGPGAGTSAPVASMAATPSGHGYWLAGTDGGIFAYGDAAFHGSTGGARLAQPIVGMAATPTGAGYWLVAADGGVFSYGDAAFHGSTGGNSLRAPIVGMAATPTGHGYWLVAADGGVFSFGDAAFFGSSGGRDLAQPIVGMAPTPDGHGYWLVAADGGIFAYGDAAFHGSTGGDTLSAPIVGMAPSPTGAGYWLAAADGGVFAFGDANFLGGASPQPSGTRVDAIAASPAAEGYWVATRAGDPSNPTPATVSAASSGPTGTPLGTFEITCYDIQGRTASGAETSSSTVAVDPSVIPLGTRIYIQGVGYRTAQDTGGAIQGHRLDIWEPTYSDCAAWGVQNRSVWEG